MKFSIDKSTLAEAAENASKVVPNRPSVPVMAGVKIEAADGKVTMSGFDYETSMQVSADAIVDSGGVALVSGRLLASIVKALPAKPVNVAAVGTHLEVVCGSARFTLPTMPVEDYPTLPAMPDPVGTIDGAVFAEAVAAVAVAAGRDETLPMMTGVRIELNGSTLAMLATDRYRLAVREIEWQPANPDVALNLLVPARFLESAAKSLGGEVTLAHSGAALGEGVMGVWCGGRRMTSRLLDGANYPPVRSLFPSSHNFEARVAVSALSEVVKRVSLVAERTTPVLLNFSADGLVVEAGGTEDARASEAVESADVEYTGSGPLTIGFNPQYLLDGLSSVGAYRAHFAFVDAFKSATISPCDGEGMPDPAHRYLLMPIRANR